jgi:hypothetical protein
MTERDGTSLSWRPSSVHRTNMSPFKAVEQLPPGAQGAVHLGLETLDGWIVEAKRYQRIVVTSSSHTPRPLRPYIDLTPEVKNFTGLDDVFGACHMTRQWTTEASSSGSGADLTAAIGRE